LIGCWQIEVWKIALASPPSGEGSIGYSWMSSAAIIAPTAYSTSFNPSWPLPVSLTGTTNLRHIVVLNTILSFSGLEYGVDGQYRQRQAARTLTEAGRRANTIQAKFQGRRIHPEVLKYCRAELMQDNYFHAVFEASKGLAQRIREQSGVEGDGANLVDRVFSVNEPVLAFNTLRTETEKTQHKGFAALLKGCFAAVRNPLAHEPKIMWDGEDDAADYFTLISLLHKKLDECVATELGRSQC
jgi:uncharacterized protein (TIGR02391 family)